MQALSLELRTAMLAVARSDAVLQLGLNAAYMTLSKVPLAHLQEEGDQNSIEWRLAKKLSTNPTSLHNSFTMVSYTLTKDETGVN